MSNLIHLLAVPDTSIIMSQFVKYLAGKYITYFNQTQNHTGTLWGSRFKCSLIGSERYFVSCLHYIESNPVRAGIVINPGQYS
jgi:putative transposase